VVGYRIYYGTSATNLGSSVSISGGTSTSAVVSGLTATTYYFAVVTLNSAGGASVASSVVSRTFP